MSYTYLLEWGEESSAECFSNIPAYVLSRLNLTADRSYCSASETDVSPSSQSGMMSEPLTENHGVDSLPRSHGSNDGMRFSQISCRWVFPILLSRWVMDRSQH